MTDACDVCCGICRIFCYSIYQCCCCVDQPPSPTEFNVICLGITNAGKTTLLSVLSNENSDTIIPTVGFSIKDIRVGNILLKVKELGGGENIRPYWNRYYDNVHAVIFVIDGLCTHTELEDTRKELNKALESQQLSNIPWLILCNKQDLEGASTHQKVIEELQLHELMGTDRIIIVKSCSKTNRDELFANIESFAEQVDLFYNDQGEVDDDLQQV